MHSLTNGFNNILCEIQVICLLGDTILYNLFLCMIKHLYD